MVDKCEFHELISDCVKRHDHEIRDLDNRVTQFEKDFIQSNTEFRHVLAEIPKTLQAISDTMMTMQLEMRDMKKDIQTIKDQDRDQKEINKEFKDRITLIDEDGKFNLRIWFKNNFIYIAIGVGAVIYAIEKIF